MALLLTDLTCLAARRSRALQIIGPKTPATTTPGADVASRQPPVTILSFVRLSHECLRSKLFLTLSYEKDGGMQIILLVKIAGRSIGSPTTRRCRGLDPGRGRTKTGRLWCTPAIGGPWGGPAAPRDLPIRTRPQQRAPGVAPGNLLGDSPRRRYAGVVPLHARGDVTLAACWLTCGEISMRFSN